MKASPKVLAVTGLVTAIVGLVVGFVSLVVVSAGLSTYDADAAPSPRVQEFALAVGLGAAGLVLLGLALLLTSLCWALARVLRGRRHRAS